MIKNRNKKGFTIRQEIDGIINKICSKCDNYYPDNASYFHCKNTSGESASACRACTNKNKSFKSGRGDARTKHWDEGLLICSCCKTPKDEESFCGDKRNKHRNFKSNICRECGNEKAQKRLQKYSKENNLEFHLSRIYYGITQRLKSKRGVEKFKNLEFNLTKKDVFESYEKQKGKCAISGIEMTYITGAKKGYIAHNASIDRIDSSMGYTKENVQLVCTIINFMKSNLSQEELVYYCEQIIKEQNTLK